MLKCRKCGDELSRQEEKDYYRQQEEGLVSDGMQPICDECWDMEIADYIDDTDYSDADPGL